MGHTLDIAAIASLSESGLTHIDGERGKLGDSFMRRRFDADTYHQDREYVSTSMLKSILTSPAHFKVAMQEIPSSRSKALDFGSLVHALVLEPANTGVSFAVWPGLADGRSAEYKKFVEDNTCRTVVDEPTFAKASQLAERILNRVIMGRPFGDFVAEGEPEASIYFTEPVTQVKMRLRMDLYHPEFSFDLKTTRHATARDFMRDAVSMHYDMQSFIYSLGRSLFDGRQVPFVFVSVESDAPHSIHAITAGASLRDNGMAKYEHALATYKACTESQYWPDCSEDTVGEIYFEQRFRPDNGWRNGLGTI